MNAPRARRTSGFLLPTDANKAVHSLKSRRCVGISQFPVSPLLFHNEIGEGLPVRPQQE
jgi:hypothetical protein